MWTDKPTLITMEGENNLSYNAELMGMDKKDISLVKNYNRISDVKKEYLDYKYPEYMGLWPLLIPLATLAVSGVQTAVNSKAKADAEKKAAQYAAEAKKAEELRITSENQAALLLKQQELASSARIKTILSIGIPTAVLGTIGIILIANRSKKVKK